MTTTQDTALPVEPTSVPADLNAAGTEVPAAPESIPDITSIPSATMDDITPADIAENVYIRFGHKGKTYTVRPFTTEEYDDAVWLQSAVQSSTENMPEIENLKRVAAHEWAMVMDVPNRATELAIVRALTARDRYLAIRCLCDNNGNELFDRQDEASMKRWHRLPKAVKDKTYAAIWKYIAAYRELPFELVPLLAPSSE